LVAEVAASSVALDLGSKLTAYRRNGVREYVVWKVLQRQIDWYVNRNEGFELLLPEQDGVLRSTVFPGLWLDPAALIRGDVYAVLALVQRGLVSSEHLDFATALAQARMA
jgi:Uma2 family endonuclease